MSIRADVDPGGGRSCREREALTGGRTRKGTQPCSGELIQSLRPRTLVDEYVLMIHPLILGQGRRLFPEGAPADLRMAESVTTTTGVIIGRYQAR